MTRSLSQLSPAERKDLDEELDLAIAIAEIARDRVEPPVTLADLFRYADDADYERAHAVRQAISMDARYSRDWSRILERYQATSFTAAAAAAVNNDSVELVDHVGGCRIVLAPSSTEANVLILMIDMRQSHLSAARRLSVWVGERSADRELPPAYDGVCQMDLDDDDIVVELLHHPDVKAEVW